MNNASRRLSQSALCGRDPVRAQSTAVTPRPGLILLHKGDPCFADEVYDHLIFGNTIFTSTIEHPDLVERTLYVNSFSKTYAMTGWRIGYIAAPQALIDGPMTIHLNCVNSVHWPTQRAALAALACSQAEVRETVEGYDVRRRLLLNGLLSIPGLTVIEP